MSYITMIQTYCVLSHNIYPQRRPGLCQPGGHAQHRWPAILEHLQKHIYDSHPRNLRSICNVCAPVFYSHQQHPSGHTSIVTIYLFLLAGWNKRLGRLQAGWDKGCCSNFPIQAQVVSSLCLLLVTDRHIFAVFYKIKFLISFQKWWFLKHWSQVPTDWQDHVLWQLHAGLRWGPQDSSHWKVPTVILNPNLDSWAPLQRLVRDPSTWSARGDGRTRKTHRRPCPQVNKPITIFFIFNAWMPALLS